MSLQRLLVQATLEDLWHVTMLQARYATSSAWKHRLPNFNSFFIIFFPSLLPFRLGYSVSRFQHLMTSTEQVDVAVTLNNSIREMLGSTPGRVTSYQDLTFLVVLLSPSRQILEKATTVSFRTFPSLSFIYHHTSQSYTSIALIPRNVVK